MLYITVRHIQLLGKMHSCKDIMVGTEFNEGDEKSQSFIHYGVVVLNST